MASRVTQYQAELAHLSQLATGRRHCQTQTVYPNHSELGGISMSINSEISTVKGTSALGPKLKNERDAKVLWWLLMSLRFVIPGYMLYVAYLYWTTPIADYLQRPF